MFGDIFLRRLWTRLGGLVAALGLALPVAACAQAPSTAPAVAAPHSVALHRIIAVGDLHGDFAAWRAISIASGLTDRQGRWTGGQAVLVQTGDVVDRGPDGLKILQDLMRLQREAARAKGRVVALVGNHEAMNMTGDLRYVSAADFAAYADRNSAQLRERVYGANKAAIEAAYRQRDAAMTPEAIRQAWETVTPLGALEHQVAWRPDGRIGQWVVGNPAIVLLAGNLFLHGGISPAYAHIPIDEINRQVAAALAAHATNPDAIINDEAGPLWYRGLAARDPDPAPPTATNLPVPPPGPTVEAQLDDLLPAFGARRIIVGHTPILSGVAIDYGGRLVRIDTGISSVFDGKVAYLEILDGTLVPHVIDRPRPATKGAS